MEVQQGSESLTFFTMLLQEYTFGLVMLGSMVVAGLLGGAASHILTGSSDNSRNKSLILGIAASFIVPVLLNMISSDLMSKAEKSIADLFVFFGFCVLAAVFSRNFLENIYSKVLQQVGNINEKVRQIEEVSEEPDKPSSDFSTVEDRLSADELALINSFSRSQYTFRSIAGLSEDSGLDHHKVETCIGELINKKLVETKNNKNDQIRFFLNSNGRQALKYLKNK